MKKISVLMFLCGLSYLASAIITSAIIRALFNK